MTIVPDQVKVAFKTFQESALERFRVDVRRHRSAALRKLLADPSSITLHWFNKEVWAFSSSTRLDGVELDKNVFDDDVLPDLLDQLSAALREGRLELHGNYIWGSGSRVYGAPLRNRT